MERAANTNRIVVQVNSIFCHVNFVKLLKRSQKIVNQYCANCQVSQNTNISSAFSSAFLLLLMYTVSLYDAYVVNRDLKNPTFDRFCLRLSWQVRAVCSSQCRHSNPKWPPALGALLCYLCTLFIKYNWTELLGNYAPLKHFKTSGNKNLEF